MKRTRAVPMWAAAMLGLTALCSETNASSADRAVTLAVVPLSSMTLAPHE